MKKRKKRAKKGEPQRVTHAVTHICLGETNAGKLSALDALVPVYLALCQQYVTLFCTEELPDSFHAPCFETSLSERWHRVAIQQGAGTAKSWRTNREAAYQDYLDTLAEYKEQEADGQLPEGAKEAEWREWNVPLLREICIQANCNVVKLEPSTESSFDYWLKISTLDKGAPLLMPVRLADYHKEALTDPKTGERRKINSSVTLNRWNGAWWLTLSYDELITPQTAPEAPVIGIDVGIANFITTSDGKHYGSVNRRLRQRQKRDREKRRRKAKLRKCLEKKGVPKEKLPSTASVTGQRLSRHVRQEINRAVNLCYEEHGIVSSVGCKQQRSRVPTPRRSARCAIMWIARTDQTSKRFAAWSVVTRRTPISMLRRILPVACMMWNCALAVTDQRSKPCSCAIMRSGSRNMGWS